MRYSPERVPVPTLTTGPVDACPGVLRAMGRAVLYDYAPAFLAFFENLALKAQMVMGTGEPPLILQGEAVLGFEAAAATLIGKDDVVLNLASGAYGKGHEFWAARCAKDVLRLWCPMTARLTPRR